MNNYYTINKKIADKAEAWLELIDSHSLNSVDADEVRDICIELIDALREADNMTQRLFNILEGRQR